ncbi:MAG: peptidylprolyl isomerase [Thermoleophilia bacterium]|nr:peptidylprolyl isomerase [Thermoleophilia bacterium]
MTLRYSILLVPIAALGLAACGGGDSDDVPSNAVAVIDKCDRAVTKNDFNQVIEQARAQYKREKQAFPEPGTEEYRGVQSQIVGYLVVREGYVCEGEQLDVKVSDDEVDKRIDELVKQYYKGDKDKFESELNKQGVSKDQLNKEILMQLFQKKIYDKVTADVKVTDDEIAKYYRENKQQYTNAATRTVRHILVKQRTLADRLLRQLRTGANFAALAKKHSTDPGSKKQGGKLELAKGQTVPAFDKVAFQLEKGELSKPVKTQFGWHIVRAETAVKPAKTQTLAEVKDSIREILIQSKKTEQGQKWTEDFRKQLATAGAVDYQAGYKPPQTTTAPRATTDK